MRNKKTTLILLFLTFRFLIFGQVIDSLRQEIPLSKNDTSAIHIWNQLSDEFAKDYKQLDSSVHYAQLAYDRSLEVDFLKGKADGAYNLGYAYDLKGKVDNALVFYDKALQFYKELGDKEQVATCLRGKGIACYFQGDYGKSIEYYNEAMEYSREHGLAADEANSMINLGVIYRILEDYDKATELYRRNIVLQKQLKDSVSLAKVYNNLGVVYTYKNQLDSAVMYLDSSIVIYEILKDTILLAAVNITTGDAYLEAGKNHSEARKYLFNGLQLLEKYPSENVYKSKCLLYLGKVEHETGNLSQSEKYLTEALEVLEGSDLKEIRRDVLTELAAVTKNYDYMREAFTLNDSIKSNERLKYTEEMEVKYETEKKEREIAELNAANTIADIRLKNSRRFTLILAIALLVFGAMLFGLFRLYQKSKTQKNIISDSLSEKEKLLTQLQKAQEKIIQSQKMASLGQLTAGIAHEINNPNNFISSSAEALKIDFDDIVPLFKEVNKLSKENQPEAIEKIMALRDKMDLPFLQNEMEELLNGIAEGANRTTQIVQGLKYFSHPGQAAKEATNLNESLETVLNIMQGEYKGVVNIFKEFSPIPVIEIMRHQIDQVFINIISNGLDTLKNKWGSEVLDEGKFTISTGQKEGEIFVSFKDNGEGISEEEKVKVFDPFFTTKEVGSGVGLGLSISYGIVEEHGGRIELISEKGEGTEFLVWLPT